MTSNGAVFRTDMLLYQEYCSEDKSKKHFLVVVVVLFRVVSLRWTSIDRKIKYPIGLIIFLLRWSATIRTIFTLRRLFLLPSSCCCRFSCCCLRIRSKLMMGANVCIRFAFCCVRKSIQMKNKHLFYSVKLENKIYCMWLWPHFSPLTHKHPVHAVL